MLRRVHVWLGWIVGVPLMFWTLSGLWMVARPIDEVRGTPLRAPSIAVAMERVTRLPPTLPGLVSVQLAMLPSGPVWQVKTRDGRVVRADAATGRILPSVTQAEAATIAQAAYLPASPIAAITRTDATRPPVDLRQPRPAWQVRFADGAHVYVDADSGAVLALRTRQWRAFDWMWGLHIMDLGGREDTSHVLLIGAAALALLSIVLALILLPLSARRKERK